MLTKETVNLQKSLKESLRIATDVSVTLDIWSVRTMRGFLGITCHYISGCALKSKVLCVRRLTGTYVRTCSICQNSGFLWPKELLGSLIDYRSFCCMRFINLFEKLGILDKNECLFAIKFTQVNFNSATAYIQSLEKKTT